MTRDLSSEFSIDPVRRSPFFEPTGSANRAEDRRVMMRGKAHCKPRTEHPPRAKFNSCAQPRRARSTLSFAATPETTRRDSYGKGPVKMSTDVPGQKLSPEVAFTISRVRAQARILRPNSRDCERHFWRQLLARNVGGHLYGPFSIRISPCCFGRCSKGQC